LGARRDASAKHLRDSTIPSVAVIHATFWANDTSKITQLVGNAAAAITGKPKPARGEHATIRLG
jgi:hypothetical protein